MPIVYAINAIDKAKIGIAKDSRIKRSEFSLRRISDLQFFEFGERTLASSSSSPMIQAHGVGGPGVVEGGIFLSANNTVVETHKGTDTTINCRITRDSDYGTVSYNGKHTTNADLYTNTDFNKWLFFKDFIKNKWKLG